MSDREIREAERALAAAPSDALALEKLAAALTRAGRGWVGETLPRDLRCSTQERGVYVWTRHGLDLEMVLVPAGAPRHVGVDWSTGRASSDHTLPGDPALWIGRFPVTNREWRLPIPDGVRVRVHHVSQTDHPVVNVTHADATAFCEWAGLRLPTSAEWTRAALGDGTVPCAVCLGAKSVLDVRPSYAGEMAAVRRVPCGACGASGTAPRLYPWGNEPPTPDRCVGAACQACGGTGWEEHWGDPPERDACMVCKPWLGSGTRPVRDEGRPARPAGASPCGAMDMVWHVWQWTSDVFARGGSFRGLAGTATGTEDGSPADPADDGSPADPADDVGFRVALSGPDIAP